MIVVVVDGLGWKNLQARRGHARTIAQLRGDPIVTTFPTTTGAALTTLTTGTLPGAHGLAGYRIMHPEFGLRTTLSEWEGITPIRSWQLQETVFERASRRGVSSYVIGRPAHRSGGLTAAILNGAEYVSGETIEARCEHAGRIAKNARHPSLVYLYIDELDRAGHKHGWESEAWIRRLEQLDASLETLMRGLPDDSGIVLTADHGMIDVPAANQIELDTVPGLLHGVEAVGGEPRLRYLYLSETADKQATSDRIRRALSEHATVLSRDEAIASGLFGAVAPRVRERIGDIVIAAKGLAALYLSTEPATSRAMIGQHGSYSDWEREVPLLVGGCVTADIFSAAMRSHLA